ncbi:MAG TPA: DUF402 domain-containing protein [Ilumatobacter sp.]|nr:DUF402 domain-containing protein [Ilumatobacter sp.]
MQVGDTVQVRFTKWGGTPHWEMVGEYLGADEYGHWVGARPPTQMTRPGRSVTFERHFVGLFPYDGWYAATFYEWADIPESHDVYVDVSSVPEWSAPSTPDGTLVVSLVDLDLDVVREWSGNVFVDDADEFAEHQVALAYPGPVIAAAQAAASELSQAVQARTEPFGEVGAGWLRRLMGTPV